MGRPVNTDHRQALLEAAASHIVDRGIANTSLNDIAAGAGTSARMLVHHFGTRDALVARALMIARQWQLEEAEASFQPGPDAVAVLQAAWTWLVDDRTQRYFRLFQQVAALERLQAQTRRPTSRRAWARTGDPCSRGYSPRTRATETMPKHSRT